MLFIKKMSNMHEAFTRNFEKKDPKVFVRDLKDTFTQFINFIKLCFMDELIEVQSLTIFGKY